MMQHTEQANAENNILAGYLTRDQLATQIGRSTRTLARWEAARKGPAPVVVGKLILYRIETVRQWLEAAERSRARSRA